MAQMLKGIFVGHRTEPFEDLAEELGSVVEIEGWFVDPTLAHTAVKEAPPALVFVNLADDPGTGLNLVGRLVKAASTSLVFPVASNKAPDLILEAFRLGAADFLVWPGDAGEALAAVRRALAKKSSGRHAGEVYAVFSGKGGQGVTSIALNLADHIQQLSGERVLLCDLNLYAGEIGMRLELTSRYTPFDLQRDLRRLDQDLLFSSLPRHERGFYILSGPDEVSDADQIGGEEVTRMLQALSGHMDFLIVDLPHDFSPQTLAVLEASDKILLVFQQDLSAVKNTLRVLQFFRELGYGRDRIQLILNRYLKNGDLGVEDFAKIFLQSVYGTLGNDYRTLLEGINSAKTVDMVDGNSLFNRNIRELAARLTGIATLDANGPWWKRAVARCMASFNGRKWSL